MEEAHVATLPNVPRYEEPGAVTLPRLVFSWLQTGKGTAWSVPDIGVLAVMLSSFTEGRSLIRDAAFEEDADGERVLVCTGARERLRFLTSVDPGLGAANTSGEIKLDVALTRLAANRWLDVRHVGRYRTEVRLGRRALELRESSRHNGRASAR
jgi:hypothetical protein